MVKHRINLVNTLLYHMLLCTYSVYTERKGTHTRKLLLYPIPESTFIHFIDKCHNHQCHGTITHCFVHSHSGFMKIFSDCDSEAQHM